MKKTALTLFTLSLVVSGSAVVGGPNPDNGYAITSSEGSSGASKGVSPNGTLYTSYFSVVNVTRSNNTGITDFSWNGDTFSFEGVYQTPTPCHQLNHQIEGSEGDYSFVVSSEKTGNRTCAQVISYHRYEANFTSDEPYKLEITHEEDVIETFEHPDYKESNEKDSGLFSIFISLIVGLFS